MSKTAPGHHANQLVLRLQLGCVDPTLTICDLFQTGNLKTLAFFQGGDELAGVEQRLMCPGSSTKLDPMNPASLVIKIILV